MVRIEDLQAQVEDEYAALGMPAWANPHPDREPLDEEYSRLTDPERYAVVHARARTWATVVERALGVASEQWTPGEEEHRDDRFVRGTRLRSPLPGVLPLFLLEADGPLPLLRIAASDPSWELALVPDCGCDACDQGSEDLLEVVDQAVGRFLRGPYVLMRGPGWSSAWCPDGGEAGGDPGSPDFDLLMTISRRLADGEQVELPSDPEVLVSRSWLG